VGNGLLERGYSMAMKKKERICWELRKRKKMKGVRELLEAEVGEVEIRV
jgi:hypothetical protein